MRLFTTMIKIIMSPTQCLGFVHSDIHQITQNIYLTYMSDFVTFELHWIKGKNIATSINDNKQIIAQSVQKNFTVPYLN